MESGTVRPRVSTEERNGYRTTEFRKYEAGKQGLEALNWIQRWTVFGSRRELGTKPSSYEGAELSGKCMSEGGTSLSDRVEATMGVIMCMATLATDENTLMGREALHRVETQYGRPFQRVKERINLFYVINKRVAETEAFEEEFIKAV